MVIWRFFGGAGAFVGAAADALGGGSMPPRPDFGGGSSPPSPLLGGGSMEESPPLLLAGGGEGREGPASEPESESES